MLETMMEALLQRVEETALPFLEQMNAVLVDLRIVRQGKVLNIQLLADKRQGGITLSECTALNRSIGQALEEAGLISDHYILEVSSPGLDRPLKSQRDFKRVVGRKVRFHLTSPVGNALEHEGTIKRIEEESIFIEEKAAEIVIPLAQINKAVQIVE